MLVVSCRNNIPTLTPYRYYCVRSVVKMDIITLSNETERLVDFQDVTIFKELSKEYTLEFVILKTERNKYVYDMVQEESKVVIGNEHFSIKIVEENPYSKRVYALNSFFDTIDDYVEETFPDGLYSITEALDLAFSTTDWTYTLGDSYPQRAKLEDYGNDNALSMLNKVLNAFNSEYEINNVNKTVTIKRTIDVDTDYQIRYKINLTEINKTVDSSDVKTAIKVFYNLDEFGNYNSSIIYRSPNNSKYPRDKWAAPIMSDVITTQAQAISTARLVLNDEPTINFEVEFVALQQAGYNSDDLQLGSIVFLVDERMDIDANARITAIKTFPYEPNRTPIVSISSIKKNMSSLAISQQKAQHTIEQSAVKLKSIYNGCTISKEDGFKAVAENGVEAFLNATEGIAIKRDGKYKFYASAVEDELVLDGKLNITSNNITMLEGFKDDAGGTFKIYDNDGLLNVRIGSNKFSSTHNGGSLVIYADNAIKNDPRLELLINDTDSAGEIFVMDEDGNRRISLHGVTNGDTELIVQNEDGSERTVITPYTITIDNDPVVTENVLEGLLQNVYDLIENLQEEIDYLQEEIDDLQDQIDDLGT